MKNVIQGTTLSGTGAVSIAPGAEITIRNPAGQLVPLWADRAGTQPHDNPFLTDSEGQFRVYADSGWVHVRAQKDGSVREWRYVPLGSAAAMDIGEVYEALGSEIYSSVSEGLSNSAEGDFFLVESSGSLDLYLVVNGVAEQRAAGIDDNAILATRAYADGVAAEAESNATDAAVAAASAAYQQATEYSDSRLQTHRESGDHDGRYYTKTEVDQALSTKVDDDDPRLSDPREWNAEVVSQSEAEEGVSSVPRKWTAERVRQAVEAALAGGAAGIYTSVAEGLAATAEGNFFWVADQASEDVLTLYRVVESDAELWASVPSSDAVHELTDRAEAAAESAEQAAQRAEDAAAATGLPSPIVPDTFLQAKADGSGYEAKTAQQVADILRLIMPPRGHIAGLRVSNNAADPDNDIDIAPGEAADSAGTHLLRLTSTLTKRLDATWAEGDGEGGLDTGSKAADTTYHVHLIRKDADGTVDALFSASADSPVLPSGWSAFRRIFSVLTDADGDIRAFTQVGDRVVWREWAQDAAASFTNVASLVTVTVPQGISVEADLQLTSPGDNSRYIWVSSPLMDDLEVIRFWDQSPTDGYATIRSQKRVLTNTSGQVRVRTAEGPASLGIYTIGYLDTRGRHD